MGALNPLISVEVCNQLRWPWKYVDLQKDVALRGYIRTGNALQHSDQFGLGGDRGGLMNG